MQKKYFEDFIISLDKVPPFNTYFSDDHYRGVIFFPFIDVKKEKNTWNVILVVCEELVDLFYCFPFHLPQAFLKYESKYSLWAQVFLLLRKEVPSLSIDTKKTSQTLKY